jgi:hypothetical protein
MKTLLPFLIFLSSCTVNKEVVNKSESITNGRDSSFVIDIEVIVDSTSHTSTDSTFVRENVREADTSTFKLSLEELCNDSIQSLQEKILTLRSKNLGLSVKDGTITVSGYTKKQVDSFIYREKEKDSFRYESREDSLICHYEHLLTISKSESIKETVVKESIWSRIYKIGFWVLGIFALAAVVRGVIDRVLG